MIYFCHLETLGWTLPCANQFGDSNNTRRLKKGEHIATALDVSDHVLDIGFENGDVCLAKCVYISVLMISTFVARKGQYDAAIYY